MQHAIRRLKKCDRVREQELRKTKDIGNNELQDKNENQQKSTPGKQKHIQRNAEELQKKQAQRPKKNSGTKKDPSTQTHTNPGKQTTQKMNVGKK